MAKRYLAPPPTLFKKDPYALAWVNQLIKQSTDVNQIDWAQIDMADSDHDDLNGREELDPTSADTTRNKHISNNDIKTIKDDLDAEELVTATHRASNSAHGATGDVVGTGDYATTILGGTVLAATAVSDSTASTVSVASADAGATYTTAEQGLINELKADVNQLTSDLNAAITTINALLAAMRTAKQLST